MIRINLLPVREARRKAGARQQVAILAAAVLATVGAITAFHLSLVSSIASVEQRLVEIDEQIKRYEPQIKQVEEYKKKKDQIRAKLDVIEGLEKSRSGPVHMLDELATLTPQRLWLTRLIADKGGLQLDGISLDNEIVASFLTALSQSPYFNKVELDTTVLQQMGNLKVNSFKIRAQLASAALKPRDTGNKPGDKKKKKKGRKTAELGPQAPGTLG
ncbi:MAG: PilN domain-containing protein [Deltaproteobacteria bacterium]|nr:MAG: PilN domain-containing protein [Deltaproteobacteria bacterium]